MLLLATIAIAQTYIAEFDLGPVKFQMDPEVAWNATVQDSEVEIDLDTVVIRAVKRDGTTGLGVMPFRGAGVLRVDKPSPTVRFPFWPPEWMQTSMLRVDYVCRRPTNLWHERRAETRVHTHHSNSGFNPEPGQSYILLPNPQSPPVFTTNGGKQVSGKEVAYRKLTLVRRGPNYDYMFTLEGTGQYLNYVSTKPLLAHPWFDAIVGEWHHWDSKPIYVKGRLLEATSRDGQIITGFDTQFNPVMAKATYMLAKPRVVPYSLHGTISGDDYLALHPVLLIAKPGKGRYVPTLLSFPGNPSESEAKELNIRRLFPDEYEYVTGWMPTYGYTLMTYSPLPPQRDFSGPDQRFWKPALQSESVRVGMSKAQVHWVLGNPVVTSSTPDGLEVWTYRNIAPSWDIYFRDGRVSKIFNGQLP